MNIGLIDVDGHHFPNLALMKLSSHHKQIGDNVEWWNPSVHYDLIYMSKVFSNEYSPDIPDPANADKIIRGGSGYAIGLADGQETYNKSNDPDLTEAEHIYPDYSLYPELTGYGQTKKHQTAYGFLTRGCPCGCGFCHVGSKEGCRTVEWSPLSEFWDGQGTICLLDPNILACKNREHLLDGLIASGANVNFTQGLDARLINTDSIAEKLAQIKMERTPPHFAMDNMGDIERVADGISRYREAYKRLHENRWNWRKCNAFVLTNFDTTHEQDMLRVEKLRECECHPYIMIYNKPSAPKITRRLQRYCNWMPYYAKYPTFQAYQQAEYKYTL